MTQTLPYQLWDADNHYYETRDCFSRHIERKYADQAIRPKVLDDGTEVLYMGDRRLRFPVVKFDGCEPPGALMEILRNPNLTNFAEARSSENMLAAFIERGPRLELMDEQNVEAAFLLPTAGVGWQQEIEDDIPALYANLRSFNRWIEDQWGYGADGRIFGVPAMSLADVDEAITELDRLLSAGAKALYMRPGPAGASRSPAHTDFDPFWQRVNEADLPVALHLSAGLNDMSAAWGEDPTPNARTVSAMQWAFFMGDGPIMQTLASLVYNNFFERFPRIRVLSIENGTRWLPYFLKQLDKGAKMGRFGPWPNGKPQDRPSTIVRERVWITPFPEEPVEIALTSMGEDRVLLGSDFPHPEGVASPVDFVDNLAAVSDETRRKVLRDNLRSVLGVDTK